MKALTIFIAFGLLLASGTLPSQALAKVADPARAEAALRGALALETHMEQSGTTVEAHL